MPTNMQKISPLLKQAHFMGDFNEELVNDGYNDLVEI